MDLLCATSREVAGHIADNPLAFLPVGAFYERGGLPPGVWSMLARHFARGLADECEAFWLPGLPYSSVPGAEPVPGEVSIPHRAFRAYLEAVADECRSNDMRPVVVSTAPADDGLPYIISREYFERTGFPLLWVDVPGLVWRTDVEYLPPGDGKFPSVLLAAAAREWGRGGTSDLKRLLSRKGKPGKGATGAPAVSRMPRRPPPFPVASVLSADKGRRFIGELCGRFAGEVPLALDNYIHWLRGRKSFRQPVKGFPVWGG